MNQHYINRATCPETRNSHPVGEGASKRVSQWAYRMAGLCAILFVGLMFGALAADAQTAITVEQKMPYGWVAKDSPTCNFGNANIGITVTNEKFRVKADGYDGEFTATATDEAFSCELQKAEGSDYTNLVISFTPTEAKEYEATLTISATDCTDCTITLKGTGEDLNAETILDLKSLAGEKGMGVRLYYTGVATVSNVVGDYVFLEDETGGAIVQKDSEYTDHINPGDIVSFTCYLSYGAGEPYINFYGGKFTRTDWLNWQYPPCKEATATSVIDYGKTVHITGLKYTGYNYIQWGADTEYNKVLLFTTEAGKTIKVYPMLEGSKYFNYDVTLLSEDVTYEIIGAVYTYNPGGGEPEPHVIPNVIRNVNPPLTLKTGEYRGMGYSIMFSQDLNWISTLTQDADDPYKYWLANSLFSYAGDVDPICCYMDADGTKLYFQAGQLTHGPCYGDQSVNNTDTYFSGHPETFINDVNVRNAVFYKGELITATIHNDGSFTFDYGVGDVHYRPHWESVVGDPELPQYIWEYSYSAIFTAGVQYIWNTPMPVLDGFELTGDESSATLTWTIPEVGTSGYHLVGFYVYCNNVLTAELGPDETTWTHTNLRQGRTYSYEMSVVYEEGETERTPAKEYTPTASTSGLDAVACEYSVAGANGCLTVAGAQGLNVAVYALDGTVIFNGVATANLEFTLGKGVYVVKVADETFKIVL